MNANAALDALFKRPDSPADPVAGRIKTAVALIEAEPVPRRGALMNRLPFLMHEQFRKL